jgi:hypothetical protein
MWAFDLIEHNGADLRSLRRIGAHP